MRKYFTFTLLIATAIQFSAYGKNKNKKSEGYQFTNIIEVPYTPVKDQANSGTCWAFSTVSFIESELLRMGFDEIDISEMYFVHFAYRQKAQKYLRYHGLANFSQGGQGHDVMNVIKEYGMVPESVYTGLNYGTDYHKHSEMVKILSATLKESIKSKSGFTGKVMEVINATLSIYLGKIPESFYFEGKDYIPQNFSASFGFNPEDYIELTSYNSYPYYSAVDLELPDNWSHDLYYNLPINELMQIIDTAFALGYSVNWDGDVSEPGFSHKKGVAIVPEDNPKNMEDNERLKWEQLKEEERSTFLYRFDEPIKEKKITDELRQKDFDTYQTTDDHLMHLVGTAKDQNGTLYYITKNSWAADSNNNGGKLYMSKSFIEFKTTAIQVHKDALPTEIKQKLGL